MCNIKNQNKWKLSRYKLLEEPIWMEESIQVEEPVQVEEPNTKRIEKLAQIEDPIKVKESLQIEGPNSKQRTQYWYLGLMKLCCGLPGRLDSFQKSWPCMRSWWSLSTRKKNFRSCIQMQINKFLFARNLLQVMRLRSQKELSKCLRLISI